MRSKGVRMLVYVYLFALIVGGVLLGASILLGGHGDSDADAGGDADADLGAGAEASGVDKDLGHDHGLGEGADLFWAFKSVRFWTFFLAFFGLTGLALDGLGLVDSSWLVLVLATVMGLASGAAAASAIRWLSADQSGAAAGSDDYLGQNVRVVLPVEKGKTGKVRVQLKGHTVDVLATTDEEEGFGAKDEAMIIEMNGTRARIARVER